MACDMEIGCLYILCASLVVSTKMFYILGQMTHVFIIAVYVMDWRKGGTMSTSDQVIISIMISRMILQSLVQLKVFWELFYRISSSIYGLVIQIIFFSSVYSSLLLSTLLGVVFYLKISNIRSVFFLRLRKIFSERILYFVVASFLFSIGQTSLNHLAYFSAHGLFVSPNSMQGTQPIHVAYTLFYVSMLGPLLVFLLSSLFLISSLYLHIRHMRCNRNVTSSLDPYYRIIKFKIGSIFASVSCVVLSIVAERFHDKFGLLLFSFPWITFGTLHSMLLIYVTPKLKNPLSRILKSLSNCWRKIEEPGDLEMTVTT